MKPILTIIVPVYNVEKYLSECLESLINQTLRNIEIILVDDASTDRSREIIKFYGDSDHRIKVIYNDQNQGPSKSRNKAINIAQGDYIGFVDSDDFVTKEMFEKMYNASVKSDADIVCCGHQDYYEGKVLKAHPPALNSKEIIKHEEMLSFIAGAHKSKFLWFTWRNIYRRDLIIQNNISYDEEMVYAEDNIFNLYAFYHAKNTVTIDENLYFYRNNNDSITNSKVKPFLNKSVQKEFQNKMEFYKKYNLVEECKNDFLMYISTHLLPEMLANASRSGKDIKEILSFAIVKKALKATPIIFNNAPKGIKLVLLLAKFNQVKLLKSVYH